MGKKRSLVLPDGRGQQRSMFTNDTASILLTLIQLLALIVLIAGG